LIKQALTYIKTAILSASVGILVFSAMLFARVDDLTAFFWSLLIYATLYFGILAIIEKRPRERQLPESVTKQKIE